MSAGNGSGDAERRQSSTTSRPRGAAGSGDEPLLDLRPLGRRLFWIAVVLAALAVAGAVAEGLLAGLTFGVLLSWGARWAAAVVLAGAVVVAISALGGARRASKRGERLGSDDVRLTPSRPLTPRSWRERGDG